MNGTNETGLDAIQLAALRKCDDVVFCHREGVSYVRAIKRVQACGASPFAQDVTVEIATETAWTDFGREFATCYPAPSFTAFEMVGNYSDGTWRTIAESLRKGDVLRLHWMKDCARKDSDLRRAGFTMDRLEMTVRRGDRTLCFRIDDAIVAEGSSARMIRNVRPAAQYALT